MLILFDTPLIKTRSRSPLYLVKKTGVPSLLSISVNIKERKKMNPYESRKKYASMKGAFLGLLSTLPENFTYRMQQGSGFAILAEFPWLGYTRHITSTPADNVWRQRGSQPWHRSADLRDVTLYTPSESVLKICDLSLAASRGGGRHEVGHAIADRAGHPNPTEFEFNKKIVKHIKLEPQVYSRANLHKWVNLLADIRLERWVGKEYPASVPDFFAIQRWVHKLESEGRGTSFAGDFLMALRDKGKGWRDEAAEKVYQEYSQEARDLVEKLEPIWSQVLKEGALEDTAHLPLACGLKLLNEIADLVKDPEDKNAKRKNKKSGEESGEESEGGSDEGSGEDSDEGSDEGSGGDSGEDSDEDSSGDSGGDSGGDSDEESGEESEGGSDGDSSGDSDQATSEGGKDGSLGLEKIASLLEGEGEAMDPSSAMEENIKIVEKKFGHKIYVPNNENISYRKLVLK